MAMEEAMEAFRELNKKLTLLGELNLKYDLCPNGNGIKLSFFIRCTIHVLRKYLSLIGKKEFNSFFYLLDLLNMLDKKRLKPLDKNNFDRIIKENSKNPIFCDSFIAFSDILKDHDLNIEDTFLKFQLNYMYLKKEINENLRSYFFSSLLPEIIIEINTLIKKWFKY